MTLQWFCPVFALGEALKLMRNREKVCLGTFASGIHVKSDPGSDFLVKVSGIYSKRVPQGHPKGTQKSTKNVKKRADVEHRSRATSGTAPDPKSHPK